MGKLVRDNIPKIIMEAGKRPVLQRNLKKGDEFLPTLFEKLREETEEVCNSREHYELLQELADVYEVISVIAENIGCSINDIEDTARVKRLTRGSFNKGYILEGVEAIEISEEPKEKEEINNELLEDLHLENFLETK